MALEVFLSYARNDDLPPIEGEGQGFVTTLLRHLEYHFKAEGPPKPHIWRDTRKIAASYQFDHIIEEAVNKADVLLVVVSNNWLHSENCTKELALFAKRWAHEGEVKLKERIIAVFKQELPREGHPPLISRQEAYHFYHPREEEMWEQEFFTEGKPSREFLALAKKLSKDLLLRAKIHENLAVPAHAPRPAGTAASNGRKVYLAKPAGDMTQAYARVAEELRKSGYALAPASDVEIPREAAAVEFIESEMQGAEVSIHLLGERAGYAPEDCDPIVTMQLVRAAARSMAQPSFRRIIWAPRLLGETVRDNAPFGVLERFDKQMDADKIEGTELSRFCEFLMQYLESTAPRATGPLENLENGGPGVVYVYCDNLPEDRAYARRVAKILKEDLKVDVTRPAFAGDPAERDLLHAKRLRECSAVVLCWAKTTDLWAQSRANELGDWKMLGRSSRFTMRTLVAAPPPDDEVGELKEEFIELPPREIDLVIDARTTDEPSRDDLEKIAKAAQAWQQT